MADASKAPVSIASADAVAALCRQFHVHRLALFGSAASGRFDPARSDLDFLVEFEPLTPGDYAEAFFGLREALERLFGRPVDLVTDASLANPHFRDRILSERQILFQRAQ